MKSLNKKRLAVAVLLLVGIAIGTTAWMWQKHADAKSGENASEFPWPFGGKPEIVGLDSPPAIGNINGVYVSIPAAYQFFPVSYKGEDVWTGKKRKEPATFDTPIAQFGIRVRLPDMAPKTKENEKEWNYHTFGKGAPFYPWVSVHVMATTYGNQPRLWDHAWLEKWGRYSIRSRGCNYQAQGEDVLGLKVEKLVCDDSPRAITPQEELMYNEKNAVVICNKKPSISGKSRSCKHFFPIHEMNAQISYDLYPESLNDWQSNQEKITALLKSFIVEKPQI